MNYFKTAYLYPTLKCNLNCMGCISNANTRYKDFQYNELTLDEYKELIKKLYDLGVRTFDISGGEPFLRSDMFSILCYIKELENTKITLVTNGTLICKIDSVKKIINLVDQLHISMDSGVAATHNYLRGTENAYQDAIHGLEFIQKFAERRANINMVLSKVNYKEIVSVLELALTYHCESITFLKFIDVTPSSKEMSAQLSLEDYVLVFEQILLWLEKYGFKEKDLVIKLVLPGYFRNEIMRKFKNRLICWKNICIEYDPFCGCRLFGKNIVVDSNGNITGCTACIGKKDFCAGNIMEESEEQILNGLKRIKQKLIQREKQLKENESCINCSEWSMCRGGCPAMAYNYSEDMLDKEKYCYLDSSEIVSEEV